MISRIFKVKSEYGKRSAARPLLFSSPGASCFFREYMQTAGRRILPVEDERVVARDLQNRLKKLGYEVPVVASSKVEAKQVIEEVRPDLVLMDIRLNGVPEGIDAAREIREKFDLPVVYLTAHSDPETLDQAKLTEPFGYVLKPFEDRELLATIEIAVHKHRMEKRLREKERLINLSHDAIITTDSGGAITTWNAGAEEIYGWPEKEAAGHRLNDLLQTRSATTNQEMDDALRRDGRWDGELVRSTRNGAELFIDSRQVLVEGMNGDTGGMLEINRDITDRKRAQAALDATLSQLKSALTEKTVLLREVHHRVKNNLAVISSLLGMKADTTENSEAREALEQSQQRVRSIAMIHEQLYGTDHLDRIPFADYARQLAVELQAAFGAASRGIPITVEAEPIDLDIDKALPCALILNELVTNSLKHAFPGGRTGEVHIRFGRPTPGCFELMVEDNGVGLISLAQSEANSLGMRIMSVLTRQIDGKLEQQPASGTRFVLTFPVSGK